METTVVEEETENERKEIEVVTPTNEEIVRMVKARADRKFERQVQEIRSRQERFKHLRSDYSNHNLKDYSKQLEN